eukprot:CAMPEP_0195510948 /NCGR_PEP_ID=MMETSP0794_2-20130614/3442_1 /TAXON_ID=515487 /ORGANISM="Stephanopyxis turris, Strain CCMP 815" /LENGTH=479 /DNA_ID=CAMNT_0040638471 /DNA_START=245 /DNA_END=1684 /DNA_ORIENTATION=+
MRSTNRNLKRPKPSYSFIRVVTSFFLGCVLTGTLILNSKFASMSQTMHLPINAASKLSPSKLINNVPSLPLSPSGITNDDSMSVLDGVKILVAIASFDFSQIPHLEEVLDGYFDLCLSGAKVDVVIHTTVAYPVTLIDMLNTRFNCANPSPRAGFSLTVALKPPSLRLHLVDVHRTLFYDKINEYDLFIYTEDDILVSPRTVGGYLIETKKIRKLTESSNSNLSFSDFNIGIVRYEYNFPPDVVINDKTRHATQDVKRVYWEHPWKPPIPKIMVAADEEPLPEGQYATMTNPHQGLFFATKELLLAWKDRPGCNFDQIRNRPGMRNKPSQPSEGTQRVWMSSNMLYGKSHCNVRQLLPVDNFGQFTVFHLPNKNYRRVGKKGRLGGHVNEDAVKDEERIEVIDMPSDQLLTAVELHVAMRKEWPAKPRFPYQGVTMVDETQGQRKSHLTQERIEEYKEYVKRGGVMTDEDMTKTDLVEP